MMDKEGLSPKTDTWDSWRFYVMPPRHLLRRTSLRPKGLLWNCVPCPKRTTQAPFRLRPVALLTVESGDGVRFGCCLRLHSQGSPPLAGETASYIQRAPPPLLPASTAQLPDVPSERQKYVHLPQTTHWEATDSVTLEENCPRISKHSHRINRTPHISAMDHLR